MSSRFDNCCIGRWTFRKRTAAGLFVNEMNPGTGDLTPTGFAGDDSELVDMDQGQGLYMVSKTLTNDDGAFCNFGVQSFSVEFWELNPNIANHCYIAKGDFATNGFYVWAAAGNPGRIQFSFWPGPVNLFFNNAHIPNNLTHTIFTKSGTQFNVYRNGIFHGTSNALPLDLGDSSGTLFRIGYIGGGLSTNSYGGQYRIWEGRVLSAADAWEIYSLGPNRT